MSYQAINIPRHPKLRADIHAPKLAIGPAWVNMHGPDAAYIKVAHTPTWVDVEGARQIVHKLNEIFDRDLSKPPPITLNVGDQIRYTDAFDADEWLVVAIHPNNADKVIVASTKSSMRVATVARNPHPSSFCAHTPSEAN